MGRDDTQERTDRRQSTIIPIHFSFNPEAAPVSDRHANEQLLSKEQLAS